MLHGTKTVIEQLNLAEELGKVSKACRIKGLSRDTFYRTRKPWNKAASMLVWIKTAENLFRKTELMSKPKLR